MSKQPFKIYFHKNFFHQKRSKNFKSTLARFFSFIFYGLFGLCYLIGRWLVSAFIAEFELLGREFSMTGQALKKRLRLVRSREFLNNHASFILAAFSVFLLLGGFKLFAAGLLLKNNIEDYFGRGQEQMKQARDFLTNHNVIAASQKFSSALKSFNIAQQQIDESDARLKVLISVLPQGADAQRVLDASALLSESGQELLSFYANLQNLKLTAEGLSFNPSNQDLLKQAADMLAEASGKLNKAGNLLASVSDSSVPKNQRLEFLQVRAEVIKASQTGENIFEVFKLFSDILLRSGNVLLVLENNNELRPGGGFIGSYAAINQSAGKMSKLRLGSIYDLDGQLKEKILPPLPLLAVNERWFLRDSNWFADFADSAKKITLFYEKEAGETPDLIIAATPNLIVDLLALTGPVDMPNYHVTLDADNFVEEAQVLTTMSDSNPENQPKQFLADLMPVLLQRLGSLNFSQADQLLDLLNKNLKSKQLIFYSRDAEIQDQIEKFGWAGRILDTDRDYLSIVASNLGGTKTDLFIEQKFSLKTSLSPDGKITNELTMAFSNKLPELDYTTSSRFIRVLVPAGAKLISNTGFDYKNFEPPDLKTYKTDNDARAWDSSAVRDIVSGTLIGQESGKTFFGNWLNLKGGQSKEVKLVYELPFTLNSPDHLSLLWQKQPGSVDSAINYQLDLGGRSVLWKNFDSGDLAGGLKATSVLNADEFWAMVIK